jgi:hypothetical protein
MGTATERIPVLVTAQEKDQIAQTAKASGLSMGEFLRRAAAAFQPAQEEEILAGMIDQMAKTTARANAAIDDALAFIEASEQRIAALEAHKKAA